MAKQICRSFAESGSCRFGSKCHFLHVIKTSLVNPPNWIFTSFSDLSLQEFSFEELKAEYLKYLQECKTQEFFDICDQIWLNNYEVLCNHLNSLTKIANIESDENRIIDFRSDVSCFVKPYNPDFVCDEIGRRREQMKLKSEHSERSGGRYGNEGYSKYGNEGYSKHVNEGYSKHDSRYGDNKDDRNYIRQDGFKPDYSRSDYTRPYKPDYNRSYNDSRPYNDSRSYKPEDRNFIRQESDSRNYPRPENGKKKTLDDFFDNEKK